MFFSKEINLKRNVKHLLLRKADVLRPTLSEKQFSRKEHSKKCFSFEEQKGIRYIQGNVCCGIIVFSYLLPTKQCLRFLLNCFVLAIRGFYQSSLGNQVDFWNIMNISPRILAKNQNFKKLRHGFIDGRAQITTLITSSHWKTLVPFYLRKKRPENAFLTLIKNYHKIVQKNKLCHPEQQQIGYLVIYDVISSLFVLIEKLVFFNKQLQGFVISLKATSIP